MLTRRVRRVMVAAAAIGFVSTAPADARPLDDELARLLSGNPEIRAAANEWRASRKRIDQAESAYMPSVTVTGDKGYENIDNPARRLDPGENSSLTREKVTLEMRYNLFDGYASDAGFEIATADATLARLNLRAVRQRVIFEGLSVYWRVRQLNRQLEILERQLAAIQRQTDLQRQLVDQGTGLAIDSLLAEGRLQNTTNERITLQTELVNAEAEYERIFGEPPDYRSMTAPPVVRDRLPPDLQTAIDRALGQNPNIEAASIQIDRARESQRQAESGWYPELNLVGTANWENNVDATPGIRRDLSVVLRGTWQVFDGFATDSASQAAGYQKSAAQDRNLQTHRAIEETVKRAWNTLRLNRDAIQTGRRLLEITEEAVAARRELVEAGRETQLVLLDTEIELFLRQRQLIAFETQARLSAYQLLLAIGELTPDRVGMTAYVFPEDDKTLQ
ncbi:TolC family protein [Marivibrio halodurans]|uniref:TolC family protein n=1 Tax=Marivibrio halodurans TaxID=2039722 RepID=A0A8J7RVE5_9PROT|nr:TolC family protein [Marivibrio halodurans]